MLPHLALSLLVAALPQDEGDEGDERDEPLVRIVAEDVWEVSEDDPAHRFTELEVGRVQPIVATTVGGDGVLVVWARSGDVDPGLWVLRGDEAVGYDENSGGAGNPLVEVSVAGGELLGIQVASVGNASGTVTLHRIELAETAEMRAAAEAAREELLRIRGIRSSGEPVQTRRALAALIEGLLAVEGGAESPSLDDVLWEAGLEAAILDSEDLAVPAWRRVLAFRRRVLPPEHNELLNAQLNLGSALRELGEVRPGLELVEEAHAVYDRILEPSDPFLVRVRQALARARGAAGDLEGYVELSEHVHAAFVRLLPPESPDVVRATQDLALARRTAGDLAGAVEAVATLHEALLDRLPPDHPLLLDVRTSLAAELRESGDLRGAVELYEEVHAVRERTLPANDPTLLMTRLNLALAVSGIGNLERARELGEQAMRAAREVLPEEHPTRLAAETNLALTRRSLGDSSGALEIFEQLLTVRERRLPEGHPLLLDARENVAVALVDTGGLGRALALLEEIHAARVRTLPPDHPQLLRTMDNLAMARDAAGDLAGSMVLREVVFEARARLFPPDHPSLLSTEMGLALARRNAGQHRSAHEMLQHVFEARSRLLPPDHPDLLLAAQNLALSLRDVGDLQGALALSERVHEARRRLLPAEHPELLECEANLAEVLRALGDLERARELHEHVLGVFERIREPDHPDVLTAKDSLAAVRAGLGDHRGAYELYAELLEARDHLSPDHHDRLRTQQNLAAVKLRLGDGPAALELFEQVLAIEEERLPDDHPDLLTLLCNVAAARKTQGDPDGALALLRRVHDVRERLLPPGHPDLVHVKRGLGRSLRVQGDRAGALALFEEVYAAVKSYPLDHPDRIQALHILLVTRYEVGDVAGSRELVGPFLAAQRLRAESLATESPRLARAGAWVELQRFPEILDVSREDREHHAQVFTTLESLRAVSGTSPRVASAAAWLPEVARLRRGVADVRRRLNELGLVTPEEPEALEAWRRELVALAEERDELERALRKELVEGGLELELPSSESVARSLDEDSAWVSFLRRARCGRPDALIAFVVHPDAAVERVDLGSLAEIEGTLLAWRDALGRPLSARGLTTARDGPHADDGDARDSVARELGASLRELVLDPVLARVPGVKRLHVVPDDVLHLVPLDALPLGDGVVGDALRLRIEATAARTVGVGEAPEGEPRLVAVGGVAYGAASGEGTDRSDAFAALAHAEGEARAVAAAFDARFRAEPVVLAGAAAEKSALHERVRGTRYLHVATHGWFAPETVRSTLDGCSEELAGRQREYAIGFAPELLCGLAFAGANLDAGPLDGASGIMTAEELATLDLTSCELAVLSACETNVGVRRAGQGIQSLQSALHAAGARTAITSLWKVDDAQTRRLMERFYAHLWVEGLPKAEALWRAKCDLRAEGAAVRDWAGWVLSGDPG